MTTTDDGFRLDGKTAFVSGATGHLGRAIAVGLATAGAHVLVNSRRRDGCETVALELKNLGLSAEAVAFDICDEKATKQFFEKYESRPLDVLVNNAHSGSAGTIATASDEQYRQAYEVSVVAVQRLLNRALKALLEAVQTNGDASVINVSSMYGLVSPDLRNYEGPLDSNPPFYGAAKAALLQFTRYAACEFGPFGIRVNAIAPGPFPPQRVLDSRPEFVARLAGHVPLGRVGSPEEVAGPVVFLAGTAAKFINGATIPIDGGWTSW